MIDTLLCGVYLVLFVVPFSLLRYYPFWQKMRLPVRTVCLLYTAILAIEVALMILLKENSLWKPGIDGAYRLSFSVIFAILSFIIIKEAFFKQFFVYTMMATYAIFIYGNAHFLEVFGQVYWGELPDFLIADAAILLQLLLTYPLAFRFLKNRVIPLLALDSHVWRYIWAIPAMFVAGAFLFGFELKAEVVWNWRYFAYRLIAGVVIIASYLILVKIMEQTRQNAALQENIRASQEVLELQRQHYQLLTNRIQEAKAIRHDFHHHLLAMQAYLDGRQYEQLTDYLSLYAREFSTPSQAPLCRHYLADAVLQHYQNLANEQGCEFRTFIDIPPQVSISDLDLCIVLGNLLENALEGSRSIPQAERSLQLHMKQHGEMLLLTLDNRFDGALQYHEGTLLSQKRSEKTEGIGLQSVRAIAEKYQGVVRVEPNAKLFKVSVMLTLPPNEDQNTKDPERDSVAPTRNSDTEHYD
nr:GHKL domain-containing protein [uncultured Anaeromusa sp.]